MGDGDMGLSGRVPTEQAQGTEVFKPQSYQK
jgi:hypothetical protein